MTIVSREFHLVRRPVGLPTPADFALVERTLPAVAEGQIRVRNLFLSVDPYMRGRMSEAKSYQPPYPLGAPLDGGAIGRIEESRHPDWPVGSLVSSTKGWREGFVAEPAGLRRVDPAVAAPSAFLGALGMPGFTAFAGLFDVGGLKDGETVLVSGAAGAVGMVVCQIAKARGCRVVAVAGTAAKVAWLREEAGVDVAIDYKATPDLRKAIRDAAPEGIDLTFENVGGEHLEAALLCSKNHARVVICGLISQYNDTEAGPSLRNLRAVLVKRLTMRGFIVLDHFARLGEFERSMAGWIAAGKMKWVETVVDGFERMPETFLGLFRGDNIGKMVVRVAPVDA